MYLFRNLYGGFIANIPVIEMKDVDRSWRLSLRAPDMTLRFDERGDREIIF